MILKQHEVAQVMEEAKAAREIAVDLQAQSVKLEDGREFGFEVTEFRKYCLLNGLDDIGITLEQASKIETFESAQRARLPWLYDRASLKQA